jgi:hypothetical protein
MMYQRNTPYFHIGNIPIGLPGLIVMLQLVAFIVAAGVGFLVWGNWICFDGRATDGQLWRLFSYWFAGGVNPRFSDDGFGGAGVMWFLWELPLLYAAVQFLEEFWSRGRVIGTFVALVFALPILCILVQLLLGIETKIVLGSLWSSAACWVIASFFAPQAPLRVFGLVEMPRKWVTVGICTIVALNLLGSRHNNLLIAFFFYLGLACWFGYSRFKDGVELRVPRLAFSKRQERKEKLVTTSESRKILKPRAELSSEHPAVERVDALLEKIQKQGMDSLSQAEKDTLRRASQELQDRKKS